VNPGNSFDGNSERQRSIQEANHKRWKGICRRRSDGTERPDRGNNPRHSKRSGASGENYSAKSLMRRSLIYQGAGAFRRAIKKGRGTSRIGLGVSKKGRGEGPLKKLDANVKRGKEKPTAENRK